MSKAPVKTGKKKQFKKKEKKMVHSGIVHVQASFNNTIVTITADDGHTTPRTCTVTVSVEDHTAPAFTACPGPVTVSGSPR